MSEVKALFEEMRREMAGVEGRIRDHPFPKRVEEGRVARERFSPFVAEQYHIITSDLRSVAHLLVRFGAGESRQFFLNTLQGEAAALAALRKLAAALGVEWGTLEDYQPDPAAHAYTAYMAWLSLYGSDAEVAAAFGVNFPAWGHNCGRLRDALRARWGMREEDVEFLSLFATVPPGFEEGVLAVMESGLKRGVPAGHIKRAARLIQAYELMFWDAMDRLVA
ncbi:MAG: hypothetical protein ACE5JJ_07660 [Nitrospinota bacterium]